LGAGASAAAGVPTAWDMIWDFKRVLFCSGNGISVRQVQDLADPHVRQRLQAYCDTLPTAPSADSDAEYAYYFEKVYPTPADRQRYIDDMVSRGQPSYGHAVLAALMKMGKINLLWTTNFDRMVEDAAHSFFKTSRNLAVADLDHSALALEAMNAGRWPLLVKIHGDFQSRRLKNTSVELQEQDAELRRALVDGCKRYGLAVVGYSGRDESVMAALEEAIDGGRGFPAGLFWFVRTGADVFSRVTALIQSAQEAGIDAHLVEIETFDALFGDLLLLPEKLPPEVEELIEQKPRRLIEPPIPPASGEWPVIRFNAIQFTSLPTTCRLVRCEIGGTREVRNRVDETGADLIVGRVRRGVLAFGSDQEIRKAFDGLGIDGLDLHPIETKRLQYDSQELGLLYAAFARAVGRELPVQVMRRGNDYIILCDDTKGESPEYSVLKQATKKLSGVVPKTDLRWTEATRFKLEGRLRRTWLLLEPTIWTEKTDDEAAAHRAREFARERRAQRYNKQWNQVLEGWIHLLLQGGPAKEFRAFGIGDGVDAVFTLSKNTAFSRRAK
jgi:NAD-dependent SIR2 family protein deacetylase